MKKFFIHVFVCFIFGSISCGGRDRGGATSSITVEPVKVQQSSPVVVVPGILIPHDIIEIKLPNPAKIAEVFANKGDKVLAGTVMARLSDEEINLKLNQLKAAKKEAETALEKNSYILKNREKLMDEGKLDKTQYEGIEIENANNEATLNRVKADLAVAEYNSAHLQITSPITGFVVEKYLSPAQMAGENQTLFRIVNIDPILVSFPLTADESAGIRTGTQIKVKIEDLDGAEYSGTVSFIAPEVHQPGKTFDVWASIPNPDYTLKTGMQATAEFISTNIHKVIAVPASSIITRNRERYIFTVSGGTARQTKVSVRNIHGGIAEISGGLSENDLIVVSGAQNLYDGAAIEMWRR